MRRVRGRDVPWARDGATGTGWCRGECTGRKGLLQMPPPIWTPSTGAGEGAQPVPTLNVGEAPSLTLIML